MATCDRCWDSKHFACDGKRGGECTCNICASSRPKDMRASKRAPKPAKRRYKPRPTTLSGDRALIKKKFGILTEFSHDQVELIFRRKREGGPKGAIAALARELGSTRDRVRTVYNAKAAPGAGCVTCGRPY